MHQSGSIFHWQLAEMVLHAGMIEVGAETHGLAERKDAHADVRLCPLTLHDSGNKTNIVIALSIVEVQWD